MAEFREVMKHWHRMCETMDKIHGVNCCDNCDLRKFNCVAIWEMNEDTNYDIISNVVLKWAAEHPEPVYPTWREWLIGDMCYDLNDRIPAEIAQKLNIKQKGRD